MSNWEKKNVWRKRGKDFMVEVFHSTVELPESAKMYLTEGENRWCVYAYIYPKHRLFNTFEGDKLWQDATQNLPLHSGCTYLRYPQYKGVTTAVKVGGDYNHAWDDHFTHYADENEARTVFSDADELFDYLSKSEQGEKE